MQYYGPSFQVPPTMPERRYSAGVVVDTMLRVWAISRWRGAREFASGSSVRATPTYQWARR